MRVPDWTTWQSVNDEFEGSVHREPDGICRDCGKPCYEENEVSDCCGCEIKRWPNEDFGGQER